MSLLLLATALLRMLCLTPPPCRYKRDVQEQKLYKITFVSVQKGRSASTGRLHLDLLPWLTAARCH